MGLGVQGTEAGAAPAEGDEQGLRSQARRAGGADEGHPPWASPRRSTASSSIQASSWDLGTFTYSSTDIVAGSIRGDAIPPSHRYSETSNSSYFDEFVFHFS